MTVGVLVFGALVDLINLPVRLIILGVIVGCLITSRALQRKIDNQVESKLGELDRKSARLEELEDSVARTDPRRLLDALAKAVFSTKHAWRLTLFRLEPDPTGEWFLIPLTRRSASPIYESPGRQRIPVSRSLLRDALDMDISDPTAPYANEAASLPDRRALPADWEAKNMLIMRNESDVRALRMPTRKYAWCVARVDDGEVTLALVAESLSPDGVNVELLSSSFVVPTMTLVAHALSMTPTIEDTSALIDEIRVLESSQQPEEPAL